MITMKKLKLKQITNVFVVDRPYVNTNYYKDNTNSRYIQF